MPALGLGCAKTKSDLVVMSSAGRIFAFFCCEPDHKPQNSGCSHTAQRFHTAGVTSLGGDRGRGSVYVRSTSHRVEVLCTAANRRGVPILLQKSQNTRRRFFRKK